MTTSEPSPLTVVQPGGGRVGELGGIGVHFKLWGEDEYSIVTEGEIGFRSGDREVVLGPGGYITEPRAANCTPRGFHEVAELIAAGPAAADQGGDLAERYGLQLGEPEWLRGSSTGVQG